MKKMGKTEKKGISCIRKVRNSQVNKHGYLENYNNNFVNLNIEYILG